MYPRRITLFAVLLTALTLAPAAASTSPNATLRLVSLEPFTILGTRFDPDATVNVRVWVPGKTWAKRTEVGERGRFTLRFPGTAARRCGTWLAVLATASDGTHAGLRLPAFECPRR
jgi:hypothetical protein